MEKTVKLSARTIIAFFVSLVLLIIILAILITIKPGSEPWYAYPVNIALVILGFLCSLFFSMIVQNKHEIAYMNEYFKKMEVMDALTGVYNRRYIDENIDRLIKSVTRANGVLSLMMIDLDFFKKYNDSYGHGKGDNCLRNIAKILGQSLKRDNDVVARYGGEEFIAILPYTDEKGAQMIADRLIKNVKDFNIPHAQSEIADRVTISIGITTGGGNYSLTGTDYINKANEALDHSKRDGRNRYTFINIE